MDKDSKNERLRKALEECLNEEIRMVPPKSELEQKYEFSRSFEKDMEKMMKKRKKKKTMTIFMQIAACLIIFFAVRTAGYSFYTKEQPQFRNVSSEKNTTISKKQNDNQTQMQIAETDGTKDTNDDWIKGQKEEEEFNQPDKTESNNSDESKNNDTVDDEQDIKTDEDKNEEKDLENSEEENTISKASAKAEEDEVTSHLVSAVLEGETAKVDIHVENKRKDTISCVSENKLQIFEDGHWTQIEASE